MITARRKVLGLGLTASILVAHLSGAAAWAWRAASDPNALDVPSAAASEAPDLTIDERVATLPADTGYVPGDCSSLFHTAMDAGWTWNDWPTLARIMARESGCDAGQTNHRHRDASYGLLQINTKGRLWSWPIGWGETRSLQELCGLTTREDLLDPATNLRCGRLLFEVRGWRPWA